MLKKIVAVLALSAVLGGASVSEASPVPGRSIAIKTVPAYGSVSYTIELYGNERTFLDIVGNGKTALNFEIYNSAGQRIGGTRGPGDNFRYSFVPSRRDFYRIVVRNDGGASNTYSLVVE